MLVEIGLFLEDQLLERGVIRITDHEGIDESEVVSISHYLVNGVAKVELCVFDGGVQKIKSNIEMPVHESGDWESIRIQVWKI